jgi:hypothetical protein
VSLCVFRAPLIQTTAGRVIFNEVVPEAAGYVNDVLTKKTLERYWSRIKRD